MQVASTSTRKETLVLFSRGRLTSRFLQPQAHSTWLAAPPMSTYNVQDIASSDQSTEGWVCRIRDELYSIPAVESMFMAIYEGDVDVWAVIPKRDISVVRQIAEAKGRILKLFAFAEHPPFFIDFYVVYREGRTEEDLLPKGAIRVPPRV